MAYSNIALPTFPEYDTAAYPYAVGILNYELDKEEWYEFHLWYSGTPFTWSGSAAVNTGTAYSRVYGNYEEVTGWTDAFETDVEAAPGLHGIVYHRIWTNHDIADADGNVWLPAGEVTPVGETVSGVWLRSFQTGLALGLLGKPLPSVKDGDGNG